MVPLLTPYDLPFPQNGGFICPQHTRMTISLQRVIRSASCSVLGQGFRGRRIERRYLRFEQIQDGGRRHLAAIFEKFQMAISPQPVVYLRNGSRSTYIARIAGSSLR